MEMKIQIDGLEGELHVVFAPKTKTFSWTEIGLQQTDEEFRNNFELNFLEEY